jgi:amidophosphoribosyltransferase
VSAPPFKYPCYFGTDIPDQKLLVATGRTVEQINQVLGADSLGYLSVEHVQQLRRIRTAASARPALRASIP